MTAPTLPSLLKGSSRSDWSGRCRPARRPSRPTGTRSRLLLLFAARTAKAPSRLTIDDLDAVTVGAFLDHLDTERHNSTATRNARLAAIHSLYRYALPLIPDQAHTAGRSWRSPQRRHARATVSYLTGPETDAPCWRLRTLARTPGPCTATDRRTERVSPVRRRPGLTIQDIITTSPGAAAAPPAGAERATPLTRQTTAVPLAWLPEAGPTPSSPAFPTRNGTRMSADAVQRLVAKHAVTAALQCPSVSTPNTSPRTLCGTPPR